MRQLPIYLFTGFLECGKTKFIQETLEDPGFNAGEETLLLVLEEGVEEYEPEKFAGKNVHIVYEDDITNLNPATLSKLEKEYDLDRIMVEMNGMNMVRDLLDRVPENWLIYQEVMFADATTFINYNTIMRSLVVDKLQGCELIIFNRYNDKISKEDLHKIVRGSTRRANIIYEYENGDFERDEIEDPLPFDINAPVIEINDEDYALFYRDIVEETAKYAGKKVAFKGVVAFNRSQQKNTFFLGRHVMTCCVEDIQYMPFLCRSKDAGKLKTKDWAYITANVEVAYDKRNGRKTPVMKVESIMPAEQPVQEVATFF